MISIPEINQEELIDDCICGIRDQVRKNVLIQSKQSLLEYSTHYKDAAMQGKLSDEYANVEIQGGASKDDMIYLYDERLVKSVKGKPYYSKILAATPNQKCPICGYYQANTLDHYLPKARFWRFAVTVPNLVPECIVCNKNKTETIAENRVNETIHPYFDDFDDEIWLFASINTEAGSPFGFDFEVRKPDSWDDEKFLRAENHLKVYKLYEMYRALAAAEINKELLRAKKLYARVHDINFLRDTFLDDCETERVYKKNSWKAAMHLCLYENIWIWDVFIPSFLNEV